MLGRLLAERGYQVVIQSCRGTFGSGGTWLPFRTEHADGHATLQWISEQPWFHGKLATFGPSYLGLTQWAVAADAPAYLAAMALDVTASNFRDAVVYPSDAFALETALAWLYQLEHQEGSRLQIVVGQLAGQRAMRRAAAVLPLADADVAAIGHHVPFFQDWIEHEDRDDPWWDPVHFGRQLGAVPPASLVAGWYDIFLPTQLDDFQALRAAGRRATLTVGPWTHVSPGGIGASLRDGLRLFGEQFSDTAPTAAPPVRVFVMGSRRWVELDDWPPPADEQRWYLGAGGSLRPAPGSDPTPDRYRYDPADPTPALGGAALNWRSAGPKDQRSREARYDVLTYTSDVLTEDLTVMGPVSADLWVRSTLGNTDFFVRLCAVSPRGRSTNLSDGIVHLRPGDVVPEGDGSLAVHVRMWPTANTFRRGQRIRLQVSSGAHPLFIRNGGTGEPLKSATGLRAADQEIRHDTEHPSFVTLPVRPI